MDVKLLEITSPDYDRQALQEYRALYEGGAPWRDLLSTWLPRREVEPCDRWETRKTVATYTNDVAGLIDGLTGTLFSAPLAVSDTPEGEWWPGWLEDVDGQGTAFAAYLSDRLTGALVESADYVVADLPRAPDDLPLADRGTQDALGLRDVRLLAFRASQAIRWGEDAAGNLDWIIFRDHRVEERPFAEPVHVRRWTYYDRTEVRVYEAAPDEDTATEVRRVAHGYGRLPVARLRLPPSLHALRVLRDPAVALLRARCALTWSLERTAYAMLVLTGDGEAPDLATGEGYALKLPGGWNAAWLESGGAANAALAADVAAKRDDLYRAMRQLFQSSHSDALQEQSGASKSLDWRALEVALVTYARRVRDFAREVLDIVGAARGEDVSAIVVDGLEGWHSEDPGPWLSNLTLAEPLLRLSERAWREAAHRAVDVMLPDLAEEARAEIAEEIEAADLTVGAAFLPTWRPPAAPEPTDADPEPTNGADRRPPAEPGAPA